MATVGTGTGTGLGAGPWAGKGTGMGSRPRSSRPRRAAPPAAPLSSYKSHNPARTTSPSLPSTRPRTTRSGGRGAARGAAAAEGPGGSRRWGRAGAERGAVEAAGTAPRGGEGGVGCGVGRAGDRGDRGAPGGCDDTGGGRVGAHRAPGVRDGGARGEPRGRVGLGRRGDARVAVRCVPVGVVGPVGGWGGGHGVVSRGRRCHPAVPSRSASHRASGGPGVPGLAFLGDPSPGTSIRRHIQTGNCFSHWVG